MNTYHARSSPAGGMLIGVSGLLLLLLSREIRTPPKKSLHNLEVHPFNFNLKVCMKAYEGYGAKAREVRNITNVSACCMHACVPVPHTPHTPLTCVQASSGELRSALAELHALELHGRYCLVDEGHLSGLLELVILR